MTLGKREQAKIRNRNIIIDAAKEVFLEQGYDACTIRDIIRKTDLAAGTFYNYFSSKEEIYRALISEYLENLAQRITQLRREAKNLPEFIQPAYQIFFEAIAQQPEVFELGRRHSSVLDELYDMPGLDTIVHDLEKDIESAIAKGVLPPLNAEYLAASFIGIGYEIGKKMLLQEPVDPIGATQFASQLFYGGISFIASNPSEGKGKLH